MEIGQQITQLRKERGYTIRDLAERCKMHIANLSLIEQGKRSPKVDTLTKILDALDAEIKIIKKEDGE